MKRCLVHNAPVASPAPLCGPRQVEPRDVDLMSACIYGDRFVETQALSRTALVEQAAREDARGEGGNGEGGGGRGAPGAADAAARAFVRMRVERYLRARAASELPFVDALLAAHVATVAGLEKVDDPGGRLLVRELERVHGWPEPPWLPGEEDAVRQAAAEAGKASVAAAVAALPPQRQRGHKLGPPGAGVGRVWKARNFPGPPGGAPPNEYVYVLSPDVANTTQPTAAEIELAKARLGRDFVVGLTEQMPSFLVLVAVRAQKASRGSIENALGLKSHNRAPLVAQFYRLFESSQIAPPHSQRASSNCELYLSLLLGGAGLAAQVPVLRRAQRERGHGRHPSQAPRRHLRARAAKALRRPRGLNRTQLPAAHTGSY